jgi:hypothetical protein
MLADVGGKDLDDGTAVVLGVPGDALEGVDAAQTDLQALLAVVVGRPELVDGAREALGDLPPLRELEGALGGLARLAQVPPREVEPAEAGAARAKPETVRKRAQALKVRPEDLLA